LIVDDEPRIRSLLTQVLAAHYQVSSAADGETALELAAEKRFDLVLSDIHLPGRNGFELLAEIKQRMPHTLRLLMTSYNVNDCLPRALEYGLPSIIAKTVPFNARELLSTLAMLLEGSRFGLDNYLGKQAVIGGVYELHTAFEVRILQQRLMHTLPCTPEGLHTMMLLLDELVSNALFHAWGEAGSEGRQHKCATLQAGHAVPITVQWGYDEEKFGIGVSDGGGALTAQRVLEKITHHRDGAGIDDESGRGLYISRMLSDRMFITIAPSIRTEVVIMNYFNPIYKGFKSIFINESAPPPHRANLFP
jgi:CheY-like chemotaxis protein